MTPSPARLWHFTCSHSVASIRRMGQLRPHPHPLLPEPLVWLTDLDHAWREALGLTSHVLMCDRTECRFEALDTSSAVWWPTYARGKRLDRRTRSALEDEPGVMPRHWWVSPVGVPLAPAAPTPPVPAPQPPQPVDRPNAEEKTR